MFAEEQQAGRIRARQLSAVHKLLPLIMVANVVVAGGLVWMLPAGSDGMRLLWFVVVAAMSSYLYKVSAKASRQPDVRVASRRAIRVLTAQSATLALTVLSLPAYLLAQTSGLFFSVIICQLTGSLWAGGLILTTVKPAAVTYLAIGVSVAIIGILHAGLNSGDLYLSALFVVGGMTALRSVVEQSNVFAASVELQLEFEHQSDVIGVLLKDYEDQTSDWLWESDEVLGYRQPSPRCAAALQRPPEEIAGTAVAALLLSPSIQGNVDACEALKTHMEARRAFRDHIIPFAGQKGELRWLMLSGRPHLDENGAFIGYRGVAADVTVTKQAEARLAYLAHHDALTALPNRSLLSESLDRILATRPDEKLAVLSLDLDGFKAVNDRMGHPGGDALLVAAAARLRDCVKAGDLVARFGGDEFVVLATAAAGNSADTEALCKRLVEALSAPFQIAGEDVNVGVSIGVAFAPADGMSCEDLIRNADAALYRAKSEGRATYRFFAVEMDRQLQMRRRLVQDLRSALVRNELVLHYQPFVSAETGAISGCEALLRWHHPERGLIAPVEFIPLAEQSGLIVAIGTWVIGQACMDAALWPDERRVSVNVSPSQLRARDLPGIILAALVRSKLAPSRLEVEVTEAVLIDDASTALDVLRQIRALGVRIALDDFGTGYSSLSYLRIFPFDKIKIDRSFVQQLETQRDSQVIVRAIRDIARGLDMTITAEGVETAAQAEQLRQTGCEELQGFLYSRPCPIEQLAWADDLGRPPGDGVAAEAQAARSVA